VDLPTYTNIWRIEKRLYKLYDFRLPAPLPITWIAVFAGITVPYVVFLVAVGLPFNHNLVWLYVLPPGVLTWLTTRPVIESKRLPELIGSQVRYLAEPRVWSRMAPAAEKEDVLVSVRVWHRYPPKARGKAVRAAKRAQRRERHVAPPHVRPSTAVNRPEEGWRVAAAQRPAAQPQRVAATSGPAHAVAPSAPSMVPRGPASNPPVPNPVANLPVANLPVAYPPVPQRSPAASPAQFRPPAPVQSQSQAQAPVQPVVQPVPHSHPAVQQPQATQPQVQSSLPQPQVQSSVPQPAVQQPPVTQPQVQPESWFERSGALPPATQPRPSVPILPGAQAAPATHPVRASFAPPAKPLAQPPKPPARPAKPVPEPAAREHLADEAAAPKPSAVQLVAAVQPVIGSWKPRPAPLMPAAPASPAVEQPPPVEPSAAAKSPTPVEPPALVEQPAAAVEPPPIATQGPAERPPVATQAPAEQPAAAVEVETPASPLEVSHDVADHWYTPDTALPELTPATLSRPSTPSAPAPPKPPGPAARVLDLDEERPVPSIERALSAPNARRDLSWRRRVKVVAGGQGPGKRDQEALDRERARLPLSTHKNIVVLGCHGGAGQTTTAVLTARLLATLRGHPVAALDLSDGRKPGTRSSGGNLDIIAAEGNPDYDDLAQHYSLLVIDPAPSGLTRVLGVTDQLVIVVPPDPEAATHLANTQQWLEAHDHADLAARAVTVINGVTKESMADVVRAESVARGRCRAIVRIPWDDQLGTKHPQVPRAPQTRLAYTALSGVIIAGLAAAPLKEAR